ncbi:helix-turn-helix domain-containing protein [Rubripirellula amarantea]|nr:helix-turn-helix domain-containing protein [Rubripirellula amarantea]
MLLRDTDPDELVAAIAKAVAIALASTLEASREPLIVDGNEMARLASVSSATLDRLRRSGSIPSFLVGSSRRYQPDEVIAALIEASASNIGGDSRG